MTPEQFFAEHTRLLKEIRLLGGFTNAKDLEATDADVRDDGRKFLAEMMEARLEELRGVLAPLQAEADREKRSAAMHAQLVKEREEEERQRRKAEALAEIQAEQQRQERLAAARALLTAK
jgi:hypothetical protein